MSPISAPPMAPAPRQSVTACVAPSIPTTAAVTTTSTSGGTMRQLLRTVAGFILRSARATKMERIEMTSPSADSTSGNAAPMDLAVSNDVPAGTSFASASGESDVIAMAVAATIAATIDS